MPHLLDASWLTAPCAACDYEIDFRWIDARLEERVWCPGCHSRVSLSDDLVTVELSDRSVERAEASLQATLDGIGDITIELGV